jgi:crotonobetainyl-CoA:carnitine CoA-transferase CaiB-like acyl-CoA transferase
MSALKGLKVVELADGLAGSVAGVLMADYGADVIKVTTGPFAANSENAFRFRNKGSLLVDLKDDKDVDVLARYLKGADIIIQADVWDSRDLPNRIQKAIEANTKAVIGHMPTVWSGDPVWAGDRESHGLLCAYAAISSRQMSCDGTPVEMINPYLLYIHGIWAAGAILSACQARNPNEPGQHVTVSGLNAAMICSSASIAIDPNGPETSTKVGPYGKHPAYRPFKAKCGNWIASGALGARFVGLFIKSLGLEHIIDEPRVGGNPDAVTFPQNFEWSTELFEQAFLTDTAENWEAKFRTLGIPVEIVRTRDNVMAHDQVTANGLNWTIDAPFWGTVTTPANPALLTRTPPGLSRMPQPDDRKDGPFWPEATAPETELQVRLGPLEGIRILNLGTFVATPMAGFLLAELGADVIKVEDLTGDPFRATGYSFNRGMRSLAVSLRHPDGVALFKKLCQTADVSINGMRPGKMKAMGLDHDSLAKENPGMISISLSAYGSKGPKSQLPGVDMVIQGLTGIMAAQGTPDAPYVSSAAYVDVTSACVSVFATAAALFERKTSQKGQAIEEALLRSALFMQATQITSVNGDSDLKQGCTDYKGPDAHDRLYQAADGWLRLHADTKQDVTGVLGLADDADLEEAIRARASDDTIAELNAAGIGAVHVQKMKDVLRNPKIIQSGTIVMDKGEVQTMPLVGRLAQFSGGQMGEMLIPPGVGEHSADVLAEGGLTPEETQKHLGSDCVHAGDPMPRRFGLTYR